MKAPPHPLLAERHPRDAHVLALRNARAAYWMWHVVPRMRPEMRREALGWLRIAGVVAPLAARHLPLLALLASAGCAGEPWGGAREQPRWPYDADRAALQREGVDFWRLR